MSTDTILLPSQTVDLSGLPEPVVREVRHLVQKARQKQAEDSMAAVFSRLRQLQDGWDSYGAPAPSEKAIANAFTLVTEAINHGLAVDRAEPSAMGGVGITFSEGMREVVVEFYNADTAHALFSDDAADDARTAAVPTDGAGYKWIIDEVQKHLDGN